MNRDRVATNATGQFRSLRAVMENAGIAVSVGGEKVAVCGREKFRGRNNGPILLVDRLEQDVLSPRDLRCEPHIPFQRPAIDVEDRLYAMAAQKGQY